MKRKERLEEVNKKRSQGLYVFMADVLYELTGTRATSESDDMLPGKPVLTGRRILGVYA